MHHSLKECLCVKIKHHSQIILICDEVYDAQHLDEVLLLVQCPLRELLTLEIQTKDPLQSLADVIGRCLNDLLLLTIGVSKHAQVGLSHSFLLVVVCFKGHDLRLHCVEEHLEDNQALLAVFEGLASRVTI